MDQVRVFQKNYTFYDIPAAFRFVNKLVDVHGVDNVESKMTVSEGWCEMTVDLILDYPWEEIGVEE